MTLHTLAVATERRSEEEPSVTFEIDGPFDSQAAFQVARVLARTAPSATVHLDFRKVRSVQDAALAVLAEAIRKVAPDHIVLHGLSHHQQVILHYLGVDARQLADSTAAPLAGPGEDAR